MGGSGKDFPTAIKWKWFQIRINCCQSFFKNVGQKFWNLAEKGGNWIWCWRRFYFLECSKNMQYLFYCISVKRPFFNQLDHLGQLHVNFKFMNVWSAFRLKFFVMLWISIDKSVRIVYFCPKNVHALQSSPIYQLLHSKNTHFHFSFQWTNRTAIYSLFFENDGRRRFHSEKLCKLDEIFSLCLLKLGSKAEEV